MTRLTARILTDPASPVAMARDWAELAGRAAHATPFQSPEWLISWIEAFPPASLRVIEVRHDTRLVGVAPFLIYPRQAERVLALAGGGVSDYLDVILERGWEQEAWREISSAIRTMPGWTMLELTDLHCHSPLVGSALPGGVCEHDRTSALALPASREEFWRGLSRHHRANLRNARSRLESAGGARFERATRETVAEFLEDLFRLHTERWALAEEPGMLATEAVRSFHLRAGPRLFERGFLRLDRLRLNERTLAVVYSLVQGDGVFCYVQGFDPDFSYFSPGTQLMLRQIEDAIEERRRRFDFLRGQEAYKRHWGAVAEPTYRIRRLRSELESSGEGISTAGLVQPTVNPR